MNPYLPAARAGLGVAHARRHREECGREFYRAALELAQSFWLERKPAQAVLQLNKAFMAEVEDQDEILEQFPWPYGALKWFLERPDEGFLGNPVRHFQHLASRVSGPRRELRSARAWVCFWLAEKILGGGDFPRDEAQIKREGLTVPELEEVVEALRKRGRTGEAALIKEIFGVIEVGGIESCLGGDGG